MIVTRENLGAPWLMFEAGALAKNLENSKVCPLLFGLEATDLTGPLVQFQAARFDMAETKRVVKMVNSELGDSALPGDVLDQVFDMWWPRLEGEVTTILARPAQDAEAPRTERDLLEEIVSLTRELSRDRRPIGLPSSHPAFDHLAEAYAALVTANEIENLPQAASAAIDDLAKPVRYLVSRYGRVRGAARLLELEAAGILRPLEKSTKPESPTT